MPPSVPTQEFLKIIVVFILRSKEDGVRRASAYFVELQATVEDIRSDRDYDVHVKFMNAESYGDWGNQQIPSIEVIQIGSHSIGIYDWSKRL